MRLLLATFLLATSLHAAEYQGEVVAVADGDTITVLDSSKTQRKVRLAGIDAPEKAQAFGRRSKFSLSEMVYLKEVTIDTRKTDKYKREIGKVMLEGWDVCLEQIKRGMAWYYKQYEREQSPGDRVAYAATEDAARAAKVGLWAEREPVPPWEYRNKYRLKAKNE